MALSTHFARQLSYRQFLVSIALSTTDLIYRWSARHAANVYTKDARFNPHDSCKITYIFTEIAPAWLQKRQSKVVSSLTFARVTGLLELLRLPISPYCGADTGMQGSRNHLLKVDLICMCYKLYRC